MPPQVTKSISPRTAAKLDSAKRRLGVQSKGSPNTDAFCSEALPFQIHDVTRTPSNLAPIINAQGLSKQYGITPLFQNVSFTVSEGDRIGLIGPNGSGKSTLLEILCGRVKPDSGEVATRKRSRLSYVAQVSEFAPGETVRSVIEKALERAAVPAGGAGGRTSEALGRAGFIDFETPAAALSGGWRKRLQDYRGAGAAGGHSASRRAHQPSGLCRDSVARNPASERAVRVRGGKPRSLLSGKCCQRGGGAQSRLCGWRVSRQRKLQQVSGEERRVPRGAGKAAGRPHQSRAHGTGMAAPRSPGPPHQGQGAHRQSARDDRRVGGPELPQPHRHRQN